MLAFSSRFPFGDLGPWRSAKIYMNSQNNLTTTQGATIGNRGPSACARAKARLREPTTLKGTARPRGRRRITLGDSICAWPPHCHTRHSQIRVDYAIQAIRRHEKLLGTHTQNLEIKKSYTIYVMNKELTLQFEKTLKVKTKSTAQPANRYDKTWNVNVQCNSSY